MTDAGWTREKPTEAGWYWWRFREGKDPVVMKIGDDHIAKTNVFTIGTSVLLIDELPGEWLGPITPDTYHQGRVAGLREAAKVAREWPWDRGPAHTNPLHVAKRKGERGASWCIAENIQSMIPLEQQAQGEQP